ncbi:MAG: hypothetical protein HUU54_08385 [Ignavibacteriaceae bacterium]|nr:hypothetical protein [Ignavibacteriaceae bacterium]
MIKLNSKQSLRFNSRKELIYFNYYFIFTSLLLLFPFETNSSALLGLMNFIVLGCTAYFSYKLPENNLTDGIAASFLLILCIMLIKVTDLRLNSAHIDIGRIILRIFNPTDYVLLILIPFNALLGSFSGIYLKLRSADETGGGE